MKEYITPGSGTHDLFFEDAAIQYLKNRGDTAIEFGELMNGIIESFRGLIESACGANKARKGAGRPSLDPVFMFKALAIGRHMGLSENSLAEALYYDVRVRYVLHIVNFADLPCRSALQKYRKMFTKASLFDKVFNALSKQLSSEVPAYKEEDAIIDASFSEAPRQRNSREENELIKQGRGDELWKNNPNKKVHKDIDARWAMKNKEKHYGWKLHSSIGAITKFVLSYHTTAANVHDSQILNPLVGPRDEGKKVYLDSGYVGAPDLPELIEKYHIIPVIIEKGTRGHPLTEEQKASNHVKAKVRCLVEHSYGYMEQTMGGLVTRTIGKASAAAGNALTCLVYNISRLAQIKRLHPELLTAA